jgi:hypothetical protein
MKATSCFVVGENLKPRCQRFAGNCGKRPHRPRKPAQAAEEKPETAGGFRREGRPGRDWLENWTELAERPYVSARRALDAAFGPICSKEIMP